MADFNQNPASQAPIAAVVSNISLDVGPTTVNVAGNQPVFDVLGTSGAFDLTSSATGPAGMYPSWRRPLRVISDG